MLTRGSVVNMPLRARSSSMIWAMSVGISGVCTNGTMAIGCARVLSLLTEMLSVWANAGSVASTATIINGILSVFIFFITGNSVGSAKNRY